MEEVSKIVVLIIQKLKENDRTIAWLARQLSCDRSNLRKTLQYPDIHLSIIIRISKLLDYDFLKDCSA